MKRRRRLREAKAKIEDIGICLIKTKRLGIMTMMMSMTMNRIMMMSMTLEKSTKRTSLTNRMHLECRCMEQEKPLLLCLLEVCNKTLEQEIQCSKFNFKNN